MSDYDLYYWPLPFRGQFVRAILAHAGRTWTEASPDEISALMARPASAAPVPFMGPPVLIDRQAGVSVAQMPACILYLGETLGLLPADPALKALTQKIVGDANDVIDEMTLFGGRQMWTSETWAEFVPRLQRWMSFWEETGRRHGLTTHKGFLLGEASPGVADIVSAVLWSTMTERFPAIERLFQAEAPLTAALVRRVMADPAMVALAQRARADWGEVWCGGQIEQSLRRVLDA